MELEDPNERSNNMRVDDMFMLQNLENEEKKAKDHLKLDLTNEQEVKLS